MKYVMSLIVGLLFVAGSMFAAEVAVVKPVGRGGQIKALHKTDKVAEMVLVKAILADPSATRKERNTAANYGFWVAPDKQAFYDALTAKDKDECDPGLSWTCAILRGEFDTAKAIAKQANRFDLLAKTCLKLGDKVGAFEHHRDRLLTGKLPPSKFLATFVQLELLRMSVTGDIYLQTLFDIQTYCPPASSVADGTADEWVDTSVMLADKILKLAEALNY